MVSITFLTSEEYDRRLLQVVDNVRLEGSTLYYSTKAGLEYVLGDVQGPRGNVGVTGTTGPQGLQGPVGTKGVRGPTGAKGPTGDKGATGATGGQRPTATKAQVIAGTDSTVAINPSRLNTAFRLASGDVSITTTAGVVSTVDVAFPAGRFTKNPAVFCTIKTIYPNLVTGLSANAATSAGFEIRLKRNSSGAVPVQWFAMQNGD